MPWRIWGNVIAGVHFFPPLGFLDQKPRCQERQRLMLLPARPMAPLIVGQARFALASLHTFFDAMFGFGHPGQLRKRGLRDHVGQIIIHLDHLLLVTITGADHHQKLLVALLTPVGSRHHTAFDHVNHQRPFGTIAHVDPPPGRSAERLGPRLDALPRPLRRASLAAVVWRWRLEITHHGVRWHRKPRAFAQSRQAPTKPVWAPHLVVPSNPAMWQRRTVVLKHLHSQLVTGAVASAGLGHPCFMPPSLILGPRSPGRWRLDSCRLSPSGHTTVGPRPPTRDRMLATPRDRTPTRHRLVPIACQRGQATSFARGHRPSRPSR